MSDEIAYRNLKPGEVIQPGDEWQTESGQWALFHQAMLGQTSALRSRRPYNITRMTQERDRLAHSVNDLLKKNHHLTKELARLQQPPAADHIVDDNKMTQTELEQMAWELYSRLDVDEEGAFTQAEHFIAERNRRRQAGMTTTDVVGDRP